MGVNMFLEEIFRLDEGRHDPYIFKAIFVCGLPGAGKNYVINKLGLVESGIKLIDIDQTTYQIEKLKQLQHKKYSDIKDIFKRRQSLYLQNFLGMVISTSGYRAEKMVEVNRVLEKSGYQTMLLFVDVDKETALNRINQRYNYSTSPADKNRKVDMDYFEKAYEQIHYNMPLYKGMFNENFVRIINDDSINNSIRGVERKVYSFLKSPLTEKAQNILNSTKNQNGL